MPQSGKGHRCGSAGGGQRESNIRRLCSRVVKLVENPGSPEERVPATAQHHGSGGRQGNAEGDEEGFAHPVGLRAPFDYREQEEARDGSEE